MDASRLQDNLRHFEHLTEAQVREKLAQFAMFLSANRQVARRMRKGGACFWCGLLDSHHPYCLVNYIIRVADLTLGPDTADDGSFRVGIPSKLLEAMEKAAAIKHVVLPVVLPEVRKKLPLTFSKSVMRPKSKPKSKSVKLKRVSKNWSRYAK